MISLFQDQSQNRYEKVEGFSNLEGITIYCGSIGAGTVWIKNFMYAVNYFLILYLLAMCLLHFANFSLLYSLLLPAIFLVLIQRLTPLPGLEGAKNKVLNAIRDDIPLTFDNVKKLSRLNWKAKSSVYVLLFAYLIMLGLFQWFPHNLIATIIGVAQFFIFFIAIKPMSVFLQYVLFTKEPTDEQLEQAILVGQDFLDKMNEQRI